MLWLIYGIPGSGKTLFSLPDYIIPACRSGKRVYTNITGLSVAGISAVANIPPNQVNIVQVNSVPEIIQAFDDEDCKHAVFVLDEMRSVLNGDKKSELWLSQRLNLMRKKDVDFIMIAQVPSYFDPEIRALAKGCSLFKRMYNWGSKKRVTEYRWNAGTPVIVGNKPNSEGTVVRMIDSKYFTCYQSYIDGQIQGGNEDKDQAKVVKVWQTKGAKGFGCIVIVTLFGLLLVAIIGYCFFYRGGGFKGIVMPENKNVEETHDETQTQSSSTGSAVSADPVEDCFSRMYCVDGWCRTDQGGFPESSYDSTLGAFNTPYGLVSRCTGIVF